jgi:predicted lipid-binding transport protein (Tim44 family)
MPGNRVKQAMALDIIIFAAIAVFLIFRLRSILGQRQDTDTKRPNPFAIPAPQEKQDKQAAKAREENGDEDVILLPERRPEDKRSIFMAGAAPQSLAGQLEQIHKLDPSFDEKQFLKGAKVALGMIVENFAKGDLKGVKQFMSPPIAKHFEDAVAARKKRGETLEAEIVRITDADIIRARVDDTRAYLTVEFTSEQVIVAKNAAGEIIDDGAGGAPGKPERVNDIWTFARNMKAEDPNWQLVETRS